jgi:putative peptidoglycan lipid II flippase
MNEKNVNEPEDKRGLLRSSLVVSAMTMISRVFGLFRDMVVAYFFGAGAGADVFFLAFRIPNLFRRLFAEGAFSQAFVPVLSEYRGKHSKEEVKELIDKVSGTLGVTLILITLLGVVGAQVIISVFAAGFVYNNEVGKLALATDMLRLTFPYLLLISMTAFSGSILNSYGRFAVPAFTPVLLNLSLILCAVFLREHLETPVMALAWGVLIAGVAQLTFQLPFLAAVQLLPSPKVDFKDEGVRKIFVLMLPALFGVSVGQINLLLDTVLASFLETGSLSWLYYSDRLLELPLALFGITIATVILPSLSREHTNQSTTEFSGTLNWAIRLVFVFGIPSTIALIFLSENLMTTLFYQGEMTKRDVSMASLSLMAYAVGLVGHMLVKVLAPGYFARQDTATPVRYGLVALASNMVLNLLLVWQFKHMGLALATSLSAFLNAGLLFSGLLRSGTLDPGKDWLAFLLRLVFANAVMLGLLVFITPSLEVWFSFLVWERFAVMLLICAAGAVTYAASLVLAGYNYREALR